mgnify:CR=1 FL=1
MIVRSSRSTPYLRRKGYSEEVVLAHPMIPLKLSQPGQSLFIVESDHTPILCKNLIVKASKGGLEENPGLKTTLEITLFNVIVVGDAQFSALDGVALHRAVLCLLVGEAATKVVAKA